MKARSFYKLRVIEVCMKPRQMGFERVYAAHAAAPVEILTISEDEALDTDRLSSTHWQCFKELGVNVKFLVIPNGAFLPVPMSHYRPWTSRH
jgi:hypothetical protein